MDGASLKLGDFKQRWGAMDGLEVGKLQATWTGLSLKLGNFKQLLGRGNGGGGALEEAHYVAVSKDFRAHLQFQAFGFIELRRNTDIS